MADDNYDICIATCDYNTCKTCACLSCLFCGITAHKDDKN